MVATEIILCMSYMGDVEHTGVISPDFDYEFLKTLFLGDNNGRLICDGDINYYGHYLYSYDDRIRNPHYGEIGADVVVKVKDDSGVINHRIFLYEIE